MELGLFAILAIILLLSVFIGSCLFSLKPIKPEELAREYLSVGLQDLNVLIRKQLQEVEERQLFLKKQLDHLEALRLHITAQADQVSVRSSARSAIGR